MDLFERIAFVDKQIAKWFSMTGKNCAKPIDVELYLVNCGIYPKFYVGRYLRNDLYSLEKLGGLDLFIKTRLERNPRSWRFYSK